MLFLVFMSLSQGKSCTPEHCVCDTDVNMGSYLMLSSSKVKTKILVLIFIKVVLTGCLEIISFISSFICVT